MHVGRWDQLDGLVDAVYDRFGKLDVLVNNAGMSPLYDKLTDVTEKLFDAVVNLNLKGPFRLSALVGERMVAAGGGSIINVSTHGSLRPQSELHPVRRVQGRPQRHDRRAGPRLRTHGAGQHADARAVPDRHQQGLELPGTQNPFGHFALQRAGNPGEIVGAALFLMSDASSYTTGSILRADGGIP